MCMPKYGSKKGSKPNMRFRLKKVSSKLARIKYSLLDSRFDVSGTSLKVVNSHLGRRLVNEVENISKQKGDHVVMDWGCDNGKALIELAKKFPKVNFVGFSRDSHSAWENAPHNVSFLHTNTQAIEKLANKPNIKGRVGVMYSHYGLHHLSKKGGQVFVDHVTKLSVGLKRGGKIILRPGEFHGATKFPNPDAEKPLIKQLEKTFDVVMAESVFRNGKTYNTVVELVKK
jgi:hypothetical protein